MTAIGIFSVKGSPGVTSLAVALAAHGRSDGVVLYEADAAGGDLALWYGISQDPGLVQAAARAGHLGRGDARDVLAGIVANALDLGIRLVPGPVDSAAVAAAAAALAKADFLRRVSKNRVLLADFGRLDAHSPTLPLAETCDVLVMVVRGDVASIGHAREAAWIKDTTGRAGFVLVDTGPYRAHEAAAALGLPCLGTVPYGRRALGSRRAANALAAIWTQLAAPPAQEPAPELVGVRTR